MRSRGRGTLGPLQRTLRPIAEGHHRRRVAILRRSPPALAHHLAISMSCTSLPSDRRAPPRHDRQPSCASRRRRNSDRITTTDIARAAWLGPDCMDCVFATRWRSAAVPPYPKKGRDETYRLTLRLRASSGVRGTRHPGNFSNAMNGRGGRRGPSWSCCRRAIRLVGPTHHDL